ncbi:hypothetical protein HK101_002520 [Irineochytrium annulatum]|nr:hypothetical protein HK101_002520 [Irineochytrium annulatum]
MPAAPASVPREPTSSIDWPSLGFSYIHTRAYVKYTWREGKGWDGGEVVQNGNQITMDVCATALHYGQTCFEGLKAFRMKDQRIRVFRPDLNARRLQTSCAACALPAPPVDVFLAALRRVLEANLDYIPAYGHPGSLYIRPFVVGVGAQIGLSPAKEVAFVILVNPVGDYYKGGMGTPVKALIAADLDRAAQFGTGHVKLGGNYAPVFSATDRAKAKGFTLNLFLDAKGQGLIEEFATSNFAGLKKLEGDKYAYITPRSGSILPGITNRSLAELASRLFRWPVQRRDVTWSEVSSGAFDEVAACGTAVVITPIGEIHREISSLEKRRTRGASFNAMVGGEDRKPFDWDADEDVIEEAKGEAEVEVVKTKALSEGGFKRLYKAYRQLQTGDLEGWETFGWMWPAEGI